VRQPDLRARGTIVPKALLQDPAISPVADSTESFAGIASYQRRSIEEDGSDGWPGAAVINHSQGFGSLNANELRSIAQQSNQLAGAASTSISGHRQTLGSRDPNLPAGVLECSNQTPAQVAWPNGRQTLQCNASDKAASMVQPRFDETETPLKQGRIVKRGAE
jgi:hypothetical protein